MKDWAIWLGLLGIIWAIFYIVQFFLAFGTAYRCAKRGADNGVSLFIYLLGFTMVAFVPGLGLHYYIKYMRPVVIQRTVQAPPAQSPIIIQQPAPVQQPQQNVIRVIDASQMQKQQEVQQKQMDMQAYALYQQQIARQRVANCKNKTAVNMKKEPLNMSDKKQG